MIYEAKSGHPGGALSMVEILMALYYDVMNIDPKNPKKEDKEKKWWKNFIFYQVMEGKKEPDRIQEIIHYLVDGPQTEEVNKLLRWKYLHMFSTWKKQC